MARLRDYSQPTRRGSSLDMTQDIDIGLEGDWDPAITQRGTAAPPVTGDPRLYGDKESTGTSLSERMWGQSGVYTPPAYWEDTSQFDQEMAFQEEMFGFEKEKWADLSKLQQERFDFDKKKWADEKGMWEKQFTFEQEKWAEQFGFEQEKWEFLSTLQQERFDFDKQRWEDEKAQFQENLAFRKQQWKDELKIIRTKMKKRPPPVWGV